MSTLAKTGSGKSPQTSCREFNFDGLVGPTHHYAGLSYGNVASIAHQAMVSNPKAAALQGLDKMRHVSKLGLGQAVLPPQERPDLATLRSLGFSGKDESLLSEAYAKAPELLTAVSSASSMWTANAATIAPSADTQDRKVHITPANLFSKLHRAIESKTTSAILKAIFQDSEHFIHHSPLLGGDAMSDEGAANHTRFCSEYGNSGLQFFVYGRSAFIKNLAFPKRFPARQTLEASQAIARNHQLDSKRVIFAQQNPEMIDLGVFHNDVASVGNQNIFFYHEAAFVDTPQVIKLLQKRFMEIAGQELIPLCVKNSFISAEDAVRSYLFNSQLVTLQDGSMALIAPSECNEVSSVQNYLQNEFRESQSTIQKVHFMDLRQSMSNGGGPACLRLRVVMTEQEKQGCNPYVFFNDALHEKLTHWVDRHYRDRLTLKDLVDPMLLVESRTALDELTQILQLGSIYPFQK